MQPNKISSSKGGREMIAVTILLASVYLLNCIGLIKYSKNILKAILYMLLLAPLYLLAGFGIYYFCVIFELI